MAGKSNDPFTIDGKKQDAAHWKKDLVLHHPTWGIDVPACRVQGHRPTFGSMVLFFFQKSTTRSYYLMNFSLPYTFFLLNGDMELNKNRQIFVNKMF